MRYRPLPRLVIKMTNKGSLLYISHVIWNWIKQRPQYTAEQLAQAYNVTYLQPQVHRSHGLKENTVKNLAVVDLPRIPTLGDMLRPVIGINDGLARKKVADEVRANSANIIWLASPVTLRWLPESYQGHLIYDCMDDHDAFLEDDEKSYMEALERALVNKADLVLASSTRLVEKMRRMDETGDKKILLVRNGFDGKVLDLPKTTGNKRDSDAPFKACYFGTIGPWFDFVAVGESLRRFPNLRYKIIGPFDTGVEPLRDPRIEYTGPVAHDSLGDYVADCDCFVMPFQLNDIVLSVDPVKMYEYINFGKDVVCVRYPEVERFGELAELYDGVGGYCNAIGTLMGRGGRKYSDEQRLQLLVESSWSCRMMPVFDALKELR